MHQKSKLNFLNELIKKERQKKNNSFDAQIYLFFRNYSPYEAAINCSYVTSLVVGFAFSLKISNNFSATT